MRLAENMKGANDLSFEFNIQLRHCIMKKSAKKGEASTSGKLKYTLEI